MKLDTLVKKLAAAIKAEEIAADRHARSNTSANLAAWEKSKTARQRIEQQLAGPQYQEERDAQLRSDGEAEMRRRLREAEEQGMLRGDRRVHFIIEVERWASDDRPYRQKWIREHLGEREAEFRQGIAQEARRFLRNLQPDIRPPTEKELQEGREQAIAWVRGLNRR